MILTDKMKGWTSADVVAYLKKKNKWKKAGHAGTLDPMATGLLIVLVNEETKDFDKYQKTEKEYEAEIQLGYETPTGDGESLPVYQSPSLPVKLNSELVKKTLKLMEGEQMQVPPAYSAVKVGGVPAYKLARRGQVPDLKPKKINIYKAELLKYDSVNVRVSVRFIVSSGTYIRSLAVELGRKLGTGGTLVGLRRTRIGEYGIGQAVKL